MSDLRRDRSYLMTQQYRDGSNLDARIELHRRFSVNRYGWYRWLFDRLRFPLEARILELGCGTGAWWLDNIVRIPAGWVITLTDLSPGMVEQARKNLEPVRHPFSFAVVDAQDIPLAADSFDGVVIHYVLQHVPDVERAFREVRRVLRPHGRFYAAAFGRGHLRELDDAVRSVASHISWAPREGSLLETGEEQLRRHFSNVELRWYDDRLEITKLEPLLAYMASTRAWVELNPENEEAFADWARGQLARHSSIHVNKVSGVFEAWSN